MLLKEIFNLQAIKLNLEGTTKEAVFTELAGAISAAQPECDQSILLASLWERENKLSTGIVSGIAIPHAIYRGIDKVVGAIGISKSGIEYAALDNKPVHVVFMLAMGERAYENHVRVLNQIFALVQTEALTLMKNAKTTHDVYAVLSKFH
jgi:mannitol/fructose-specific phosphotransferase system IIA component (Ntr-type)